MRRITGWIWIGLAGLILLAVVVSKAVGASRGQMGGVVAGGICRMNRVQHVSAPNAYDREVLDLRPTLYLTLGDRSAGSYSDWTGNGHEGKFFPPGRPPGVTTLPNRSLAATFNGAGQYLEVASSPSLSVTRTGCLTVEAWMRPSTLQFPREEGSGYVYVLGKGSPGMEEYALRIYSRTNSENPPVPTGCQRTYGILPAA